MSEKLLQVAVIGLGRRSLRHAIPYFAQETTSWQLAAVCDPFKSTTEKFKGAFPAFSHVLSFPDVSSMISLAFFDCAYVAVPHYQSAAIVRELLASKINVLKEKPAAMTAVELESLQELARSNAVTLNTASQFRYGEQFRQTQQWLPLIGQIRFVEGAQKIAVCDLGDGWRASKMLSGGGVLIDLGWHLVDLVLSLLGDSILAVEFAQTLKTCPLQQYDCEDTARATFLIHNSKLAANNIPISCGIFVTRLGPTKTFQLIIYGESGSLRMDSDTVELNLAHESEIKDFGINYSCLNSVDIV
jgi:predicted dehydrogenase